MHLDFLFDVFVENQEKEAIIWKGVSYNYNWLLKHVKECQETIETSAVYEGTVVGLIGDFSPRSVGMLLSLIEKSCIIVPFSNTAKFDEKKYFNIASVEIVFRIDKHDNINKTQLDNIPNNIFYNTIRERRHPGLVLFTSGTSGEPKAAVHDFTALLEKFKIRRTALRTLNFLLFDHWGGLNTLFHTLSNGGLVLAIQDRSPDAVAAFIEKHKIELLPASPTFLNLLLISEAYKRYDLSSLQVISYGTEPMTTHTLNRLSHIFPNVRLQQTYGLIELGVLRSKSKSNDSLLVKVGGEGYDVRIVEGMLQIKADSVMLGYLNAPSPFTDDGWFKTGDAVIQDGEYIRILGRKSELINVGGEKVYPVEIENVIQELDNVADVTVYSEKNLITGNIICAKVTLIHKEDKNEFNKRLKLHCQKKLEKYKVPVKIVILEDEQFSQRFKKIRRGDNNQQKE